MHKIFDMVNNNNEVVGCFWEGKGNKKTGKFSLTIQLSFFSFLFFFFGLFFSLWVGVNTFRVHIRVYMFLVELRRICNSR
jgi:hypothetical protein